MLASDYEKFKDFCEKNNIKYHFVGNLLFCSTPFGKWYFDVFQTHIIIYHENEHPKENPRNGFLSNYHKQGKTFDNILAAISYIERHDFNKLKRENKIYKESCNQKLFDSIKKIKR